MTDQTKITTAPEFLMLLQGSQPGVRPIDWISALLIHFDEHYSPDKDEDHDATMTMRSEVSYFLKKARLLLSKIDHETKN